jgi:hypothetical protein
MRGSESLQRNGSGGGNIERRLEKQGIGFTDKYMYCGVWTLRPAASGRQFSLRHSAEKAQGIKHERS